MNLQATFLGKNLLILHESSGSEYWKIIAYRNLPMLSLNLKLKYMLWKTTGKSFPLRPARLRGTFWPTVTYTINCGLISCYVSGKLLCHTPISVWKMASCSTICEVHFNWKKHALTKFILPPFSNYEYWKVYCVSLFAVWEDRVFMFSCFVLWTFLEHTKPVQNCKGIRTKQDLI